MNKYQKVEYQKHQVIINGKTYYDFDSLLFMLSIIKAKNETPEEMFMRICGYEYQ